MHPILFSFGDSFFIGTYGLLVATGLLVAIQIAAFRARKRGIQSDRMYDLAFLAVLSGFIAARLLYIILNFGEFRADPGAMIFSRTGFVFLGGFVGAAVSCIVWLQWHNLPVLKVGDLVAPSLAIGHGFGRIGCHLAGCCWGGVCRIDSIGLKVEPHVQPNGYPFGNAYLDQFEQGLIPHGALHSLPVWPVQLMEAISLFALGGALLWYASKPRRSGYTLAFYLIGYSIIRFVLEFLRGDLDRGMLGGLSTSQIISLLLLPVGVGMLVRFRGKTAEQFSPVSENNTGKQAEAGV